MNVYRRDSNYFVWHRLCASLLLPVLLIVAGCSSRHAAAPPFHGGLVGWQGTLHAVIPGDLHRQVEAIHSRIATAAGLVVPLRIDADPTINAFAKRVPGGGYEIVLNAGLLDLVGYDRDQIAFVLAHEISHVALLHLSDEQLAAQRQQSSTMELISMLADIVVPLSGLALSAGHAMREAGYSREQEIDADRRGILLMRKAGYDPAGATRFHQMLMHVSNPSQLNLLSTHPPGEARLKALQEASAP